MDDFYLFLLVFEKKIRLIRESYEIGVVRLLFLCFWMLSGESMKNDKFIEFIHEKKI